MAARLGYEATGIDTAQTAIAIAQGKARDRGLTARFLVGDALRLSDLHEQFDNVLDCGLFHVFDDGDRVQYVDSLRAVLPPGGHLYVLCFSDRQPGDWGPRRVTQDKIRASFRDGWQVDSIEASTIATNNIPAGALAWRVSISRS
jgi:SAM-dependent methyltransferase